MFGITLLHLPCYHRAAMPDDRVARMPLRNRAGEVVAYAVVDAEDAEQVGRYRWHLDPNGDAARSGLAWAGSGGSVPMHREILGLLPGAGRRVIHLDGDALNNRRANLRVVAAAEVPQRGRPQRDGTSAHRGVCWSATARKWRAYGNLDGRQRHPGLFDDEAEVAPVAAEWRRQHMPYSAEAMEDARTTDVPPPEGCRSGKPTR